jgi:hypothetical protein
VSFALHTPQQAAHATRRVLSLDGACPPAASRFEVLRATIWSLAAPPNIVHVTRVLGSALPSWQLLSERPDTSDETLRAELREALSTLQDAGDLIELRGGYWASATARFVRLPAGAGYLLVAGVPTALLPLTHDSVQYHGPHRHLAELPKELAAVIPLEDLASWAKLPSRDLALQDWAQELVDSLKRQPYAPTSAEAFEFYLPAAARPGTPQFKRWSESPGNATGTVLARRTRVYGAREYRLVEVRSSRITSVCDLQGVDVRRLMYALDLAVGNPVQVRCHRVSTGTEWLFTSELPRAEQRVFATLGTLTIPDHRPFERRWTFVRNEELALGMLRSLGVQLAPAARKDRR